jgi:amino acid transporter
MAIGSTWTLGFVLMIVLAACMDTNLENILTSPFGQPMAQIYYDAVGKRGAIGLMTVLFIVQFFMGLSTLVAASRQSWAFSRDGALPFSSFFRVISVRLGYVPFRMIWGCVLLGVVLGLLSLIAPAAAQALFSLAVAAQGLAYAIPILARIVWRHKFKPGSFNTGVLSIPIACVAVAYLAFEILLSMFPVGGPDPTPSTMNYTVVSTRPLTSALYGMREADGQITGRELCSLGWSTGILFH